MLNRDTVRLGVTAHRPGRIVDVEAARKAAEAALDAVTARWQKVVVVAGGAIGFDHFVCAACVRRRIPFELVLPCLPDVLTAFWKNEQRLLLAELCQRAVDVTIVNEFATPSAVTPWVYHERNAAIVRQTDRLVAYWDGRRGGGTWWTIQHALKAGKPVTNAFGNLHRVGAAEVAA